MRMNARIANEVREINQARERTAPKRLACPLCGKNYPNIHVNDRELNRVYMVCLPCAREYVDKYGPGVSGDELCKIMRHLTPDAPDKSRDSVSQAEPVKSSNPPVESEPFQLLLPVI